MKEVILSFFNDASLEELMVTPGCSKKKSEIILNLRPFESWDALVCRCCLRRIPDFSTDYNIHSLGVGVNLFFVYIYQT